MVAADAPLGSGPPAKNPSALVMDALGKIIVGLLTKFEFRLEEVTLTEAQPKPTPFIDPVHPAWAVSPRQKSAAIAAMRRVISSRMGFFISRSFCLCASLNNDVSRHRFLFR